MKTFKWKDWAKDLLACLIVAVLAYLVLWIAVLQLPPTPSEAYSANGYSQAHIVKGKQDDN